MTGRKPEGTLFIPTIVPPQPGNPGTDRNAITLPNSPLRLVENVPLKHVHKSKVDLQSDCHKAMARIRSLNRIDIRSPVFGRSSAGFGLSPHVTRDDETSLYTTRTIALRILLIIPTAARTYYNDFTTIDWAKAYMRTNMFYYQVHHGKTEDGDQKPLLLLQKVYYDMGMWILIGVVAFFFALIAYFIDKTEILLVGLKHGYCRTNWFASLVSCCANTSSPHMSLTCSDWISWSSFFESDTAYVRVDYIIYVLLTVTLAFLAGCITMTTKIPTRLPATKNYLESAYSDNDLSHIDDNGDENNDDDSLNLYTAAGSGVPEVKTILSGFVIRRFLGGYTLFAKTIALVLAIASGMALGKEGPYVHLATCVGNVASRLFPFINNNDYLKKEILSASASSGVALAFGSPLGGVLFILEEINNYLPSNQLFLIFFCAVTSTLFLKFLNPYGTNKTVLFELNYVSDWRASELPFFVIIGIAGGMFGAAFIRFTKWWPTKFRQTRLIKDHPLVEIVCISLLTGLVTFWNPYTKQDASELVLDLATSCSSQEMDSSLCPTNDAQFATEIRRLFFAFVIKVVLTFVTFGLKVPCGIYVPSMVVGALFGRLFAMCIQLAGIRFLATSNSLLSAICPSDSTTCVDLGIYSMISAGAFMAGVTRMNITLVTILFELTSSYTYVLPIAIAIAVANWLGGLIEENSLYECLLITNDYPFMSPEKDAVDPYTSSGDLLAPQAIYPDSEVNPSHEESKSTSVLDGEEPNRVNLGVNSLGNIANLECQLQTSKDNRLYIDITHSPYVSSNELQKKLLLLAKSSLLDGCVAIVKDCICVGTIYFAELEFCLDRLQEFTLEFNLADVLYCKVYEPEDYQKRLWMSHKGHNDRVLDETLEIRRLSSANGDDYFNYGSNSEYLDLEIDKLALRQQMDDLCNLTSYVDTNFISINYDLPLSLAHLIFDRIGTRTVILTRKGKYYGVLHKKVFVDYCRRPQ